MSFKDLSCGKYTILQNTGFVSRYSYVLDLTNKSEYPLKVNILEVIHMSTKITVFGTNYGSLFFTTF